MHYSFRGAVSEEIDKALSRYEPLTRALLAVRGITSETDAERFLAPDYERDTYDPFLLKGMEQAVERLQQAKRSNEHVAIWSDYDMDGIPGAVVLWDTLKHLGYENVVHHTPHRNKEGFGLNSAGLMKLKEDGVTLVITIDCGIGDVEQVAWANKHGIDVVVTDHHLPNGSIPPAVAVVNPKQAGCAYPEKMLCGAAVAFKLSQALLARTQGEERNGWEKWLLDMVGMSTVADLVPLVGENRVLAHFGLIVLRKSRRPGLQALLRKARTRQRVLTEDDIGFSIAPRINAASRMGHARDAFELLATNDEGEAGRIAHQLEQTNNERKGYVAAMAKEIKSRIAKLGEPKEVIVMGNPDWKPSLLGLVAGSLVEQYERPVFLWGKEESAVIKGSCRSDGSVNVVEMMAASKTSFIEFGGHAFSGGFAVEQQHIHTLEEALITAYKEVRTSPDNASRFIDAELSLEDVTWDLYRTVARLAPFGEGNPKPVFLFRSVQPAQVRTFGKAGEHLELVFDRVMEEPLKAMTFFASPDSFEVPLSPDSSFDLVATLEESTFRHPSELRLRIVDVKRQI